MEPLWSPVVAIGGKQWQIGRPSKPQRQAKSVATGCRPLPEKYMVSRASAVGCHPLREVPSLRRRRSSPGLPASLGERNVVGAADCPAFDDVGVDADIR